MLYWVIFFITVILIVAVILLMLKLNILLEFSRNGWDDHLVITFYTLGGLIRYQYEVPMFKIDESEAKPKKPDETDKEFLRFFEIFYKVDICKDKYHCHESIINSIRNYMKNKLDLVEFDLKITMGSGEAFYTGILTGIVWAAAGILISLLENYFIIQKKCVDIKVDFKAKKFKIDFNCIFTTKVVHIIVVMIKILRYIHVKKVRDKKTIGGGISG